MILSRDEMPCSVFGLDTSGNQSHSTARTQIQELGFASQNPSSGNSPSRRLNGSGLFGWLMSLGHGAVPRRSL